MTTMIENLIQNASENAYVSVSVVNTADGKYRVTEMKKLRDLSDEVRRVYEDSPKERQDWMMVFIQKKYLGDAEGLELFRADSSYCYIGVGSVLDECRLSALQKAHERLLAVEKAVTACDEHTIIYLGGSEPAIIKVLDCKHADGSVYSWYIRQEDTTEYAVGDFVEVEHLGDWKNEYLKVVCVREINPTLEDTPACPVVRLAAPAIDSEGVVKRRRRRNVEPNKRY